MTLTKQDTKNLAGAVVKALAPRFKQIDEQFENMSLEIGSMFKQLATKEELRQEIDRLDDRIDQFEDGFEQFTGSMGVFESRAIQRFNDLDEKLNKHDEKFEQIIKHVGGHSLALRNHEARLSKLGKSA